MIQDRIHEILRERGPLSGRELQAALPVDRLELWRECHLDEDLIVRNFGCQYLRLDRRIPSLSRLSPSILRGFHTYTVIALRSQRARLEVSVNERLARVQEISRFKTDIAASLVSSVLNELAVSGIPASPAAFLIAGDTAYGMSHDEPRPERSTGRLVRGSDIDLVVLLRDSAPDTFLTALDDAIHREKFRLLINPGINQEIDYVVKRMERLREQAAFDTFRRMVACKIIKESLLIAGDAGILDEAREILSGRGVFTRLEAMEEEARAEREEAVRLLLESARHLAVGEVSNLFYSAEESEEFE